MAQNKSAQKVTNSSSRGLSTKHLLIFVAVFAAIGVYALYRAFAATPTIATVEAERLTYQTASGASVLRDTSASGGMALRFNKSGTATGTVNLPSRASSIVVVAKGVKCTDWPKLTVKVDGATIISNRTINSQSWKRIATSRSIAPGLHRIEVSSQASASNPACAPTLDVDSIIFNGQVQSSPSPTLSLSAADMSIQAGSSTTITWSAPSSSSCTASGDWNGPQPTQGTFSTGALNRSASYSLSCTGSSGNVSSSITVNVQSNGTDSSTTTTNTSTSTTTETGQSTTSESSSSSSQSQSQTIINGVPQ